MTANDLLALADRLCADHADVEDAWRAMDEAAACLRALAGRLPKGWRLVPIEPTYEMCTAPWNVSMSQAHSDDGVAAAVWAAMLSVAPTAPGSDE